MAELRSKQPLVHASTPSQMAPQPTTHDLVTEAVGLLVAAAERTEDAQARAIIHAAIVRLREVSP